jgi:hypothetical protein
MELAPVYDLSAVNQRHFRHFQFLVQRDNGGALASATTHTKVLNVTRDYLRQISPELSARYDDVSQQALKARELFSYSFPAEGLSSARDSLPPNLGDVIDICQALAELAQLHSECIQSAFRGAAPVSLDRESPSFRNLYQYEHRLSGSIFVDSEDRYRLWQIERHLQRPLSLHIMARQGLVEDFFGAWTTKQREVGSFDPDKTDWRLIFDFS